jgi:hypothetical protein
MATFNQIVNEYQFKTPEDKNKALLDLLGKTQKRFGKESIKQLDGKVDLNIPNIPSGILSLDLAIGIGGLPKGRIVEFYGDNSAGKCLTYETYTNLMVEDDFYQYLKSRGFIQDGAEKT